MPYALFSNDVKVSQAFSTKSDVWQYAARSGLVLEVSSGEEDPPRRILNMGYAIHSCAPDTPETMAEQVPCAGKTGSASISDREMAQLAATCSLSQPSAVAAS